jgi:hypothetical protein
LKLGGFTRKGDSFYIKDMISLRRVPCSSIPNQKLVVFSFAISNCNLVLSQEGDVDDLLVIDIHEMHGKFRKNKHNVHANFQVTLLRSNLMNF